MKSGAMKYSIAFVESTLQPRQTSTLRTITFLSPHSLASSFTPTKIPPADFSHGHQGPPILRLYSILQKSMRRFNKTIVLLLYFLTLCQTSAALDIASLLRIRRTQLPCFTIASETPLAHINVFSPQSDTAWLDTTPDLPWSQRARRNHRRAEEDTSTTSQSFSTILSTLSTTTSSFASTSSVTSASATTSTTLTASTLPQPFDAGITNNFTKPSCPIFFNTFLTNTTFLSCQPVSLLLQTSTSFFQDTKSYSLTNQVLNISCAVNSSACSALMSSYATQLISSSNCLNDYNAGNPVVQQAYNGLIAYDAVYGATCLRDETVAKNYCFTDAVTNASSPTSSYVYYLPVGVPLPNTTMATCNKCLQTTMKHFAGYATNGAQPVSKTYGPAAMEINAQCGAGFVDASVIVTTSAGTRSLLREMAPWNLLLLILPLLCRLL